MDDEDVSQWKKEDVGLWLRRLDLEETETIVSNFHNQGIKGPNLEDLNDNDLQMTLGVNKLGDRKTILREIRGLKAPPPPTGSEDQIVHRVTENLLKQFQQLQQTGQSSFSYAEFYQNNISKAGTPIAFPGGHKKTRARTKNWNDMVQRVKEKHEEFHIQDEFMEMIRNMKFENIEFHNTHALDVVAYPQKPDVTGVIRGLALHPFSAVVLFELRAFHRQVDGKMKGQLCSAVNRVWKRTRQELYGFAMNGRDDSTFIYHIDRNGSWETSDNTHIENAINLLGSLDDYVATTRVDSPKISGYKLSHLIGSGKTSLVYCVISETKQYHVLKVPQKGYDQIVVDEARIMYSMNENSSLWENKHLAKIFDTTSVKVGTTSVTSLLSYPCGIDKVDGKLSLAFEDVFHLVGALRDLHKAKWFHRDVSPSNIGHYLSNDSRVVFLRDFGFSIRHSESDNKPYEGAMVSASKSVLESLRDETQRGFTARDDFESLVKSVIISVSGCSPLVPLQGVRSKASALLKFWQVYERHIEVIVDSLMDESKGDDAFMSFFAVALPLQPPPSLSQDTKVPSPTRRPRPLMEQKEKEKENVSKKRTKKRETSTSMGSLNGNPLPYLRPK